MADTRETAAMLLDELAAPDPLTRRQVAKELRNVTETFAEVPDGKTASCGHRQLNWGPAESRREDRVRGSGVAPFRLRRTDR